MEYKQTERKRKKTHVHSQTDRDQNITERQGQRQEQRQDEDIRGDTIQDKTTATESQDKKSQDKSQNNHRTSQTRQNPKKVKAGEGDAIIAGSIPSTKAYTDRTTKRTDTLKRREGHAQEIEGGHPPVPVLFQASRMGGSGECNLRRDYQYFNFALFWVLQLVFRHF